MLRYQLFAFIAMIGLILLNRWIFTTLFDTEYLLWYIDNGVYIGAGITFISLASKRFKKDVNAVSADPLTYLVSYLRYLTIPYITLGTDLRLASGLVGIVDDSRSDDIEVESELSNVPDPSPGCLPLLLSSLWNLVNGLLTLLWMLILIMTTFLWVIIVVPLQYFVFLVCGAPARMFHQSDYRAITAVEGRALKINYVKKSEETPNGWQDASLGIEPVTLTNLLSILFFAAVKFIVL
jgi:hypothetical protein